MQEIELFLVSGVNPTWRSIRVPHFGHQICIQTCELFPLGSEHVPDI